MTTTMPDMQPKRTDTASTKNFMEAHGRTMKAMSKLFTGDPDVDSRVHIVPHHEGAVSLMVGAKLRLGSTVRAALLGRGGRMADDGCATCRDGYVATLGRAKREPGPTRIEARASSPW